MPKKPAPAKQAAPKTTRSQALINLMRVDGGATVQALAEAIGWQVHSVRGFIAGQLKKWTDLTVIKIKTDGPTRYQITDAQ